MFIDSFKNEEYQGVVFVHKNRQSIEANDDSLEEDEQSLIENSDSLAQKESKVKESKVKESKVKESKVNKTHRENPRRYYPDEPLNQTFLDFIEMRKKIKKPMTDRAIELAMKKLKNLSTPSFSDSMDNDVAIEILEQSIMNCWQGLFPIKEKKQRSDAASDWEQQWRKA